MTARRNQQGQRRRPNATGGAGLSPEDERRLRRPYRFEHKGRQYELPSLTSVKSGVIRRIRNMDEADAMYTMMEEVASPEALAAIDDMDMIELAHFQKGWQEHAGVSLGELRRSSN